MGDANFWTADEQQRYADVLRTIEREHDRQMQLARERIASGFYLTDDAARAAALAMLVGRGGTPS